MSDNSIRGRREFLKLAGLGVLAGAAASCGVSAGNDGDNQQARQKEPGKMAMRTNPNSGDEVSVLGYGMMRLPTITETVDGQPVDRIDQEQVNRLVDYAMEHGVNYYDTSPAYCQGRSEQATGIALSRHPRDSYFIATKLSNFADEQQSHERSIEMFENSLKYLQTDYVDYLLLHAIGGGGMTVVNKRYIDNGILEYLNEQKAAGRIRNLGFSFHGDVEVFDTMMEWHDQGKQRWDFVQIQLNYVDWYGHKDPAQRNIDAEYLYDELRKRGIPAVIMEPLLGGRLANMPDQIAAKMKQRRPGDSLASWAFRFAGSPEGVLTVLSGMTYMEHLQDNLATYSPLEPVTDDEGEFLRLCTLEYLANDIIPCTGCNYCMPCPYGLDIPGIFQHYNKCVKDDNVPRDTRDPRYAKARRAFLVGYDRKVPKERQASRCVGCAICVPHCQQQIPIPGRMRQIDDYVSRLRAGKA